MATGDKYLSISENRLLGWQSLKNLFFDYLEKQGRTMAERVYATGSTFGVATQLVADGNRKFKLSGFPTGTVSAVDGQGRFLDFRERTEDIEEIQFENSLGVEYEVAVRQAPLPGGLFVNPADGNPIWNYYEDIVGVAGTPDSVTDNGDGTLTFVVDGITEAARDNSGRQVYVYKNTITKNAFTEQLAKQLCTTTYSGGNNKITTTLPGAGGAGTFGQVVASTTASHYTVILVGPRVAVGLDLLHDSDYCFIGTVTGAGGITPPSTFYMGDQNCYDFDLTLLSDITRLESASGTDRLKVDVKVITGDGATDQIRVTNGALTPSIRFKVDGSGNVTIEGNLTVTGTTYQHNIEQYNATTATIDNLTAGNADTDAQAFKGEMTHTHGTGPAVTDFQIDGATGEVGVGTAKETGVNVKLGGRVLHKVSTNPFFEIDSTGRVGLGGLADTDATPVAVRLYGRVLHKVSSTPYFEIASDGKIGIGGAVDSAYQTLLTGSTVHKAGGSTQFFAIESDGRIGLGGAAEASVAVKMTGRVLHKVSSTPYFEIGSDGKIGIGGAVDATYQNLFTGTTVHKTSTTVNFDIDPAGYVGIGGVHEDTFALKVTGNVKVTGTIESGSGFTMGGHLKPGIGNTYDLGEESPLYWRSVFAATGQFSNLKSRDHLVDITVFNSLLSNGTSLTLGSGTYYWGAIHATDAYLMTLRARNGVGPITLHHNIVPVDIDTREIGTQGYPFHDGRFTYLSVEYLRPNGASTTKILCDNLWPSGSKDLGATGSRWNLGCFTRVHSTYLNNNSSDITLESNLVPTGDLNLGSWTVPMQYVYAKYLKTKATNPSLQFYDTDGGSGEKAWAWIANGGYLELYTQDDAEGSSQIVERIDRNGNAPYIHEFASQWFRPITDAYTRLGDISPRSFLYVFVDRGYMIKTDVDMGGTTSGWSCFTAVLNAPTDTNDFHVHGGGASATANKYWMKFYCNTEVLAIPVWEWSKI